MSTRHTQITSTVRTRIDQPARGDGTVLVTEFHGAEFIEQLSDGRRWEWLKVATPTGELKFRRLPGEDRWVQE